MKAVERNAQEELGYLIYLFIYLLFIRISDLSKLIKKSFHA